jgi:hypothetical protein
LKGPGTKSLLTGLALREEVVKVDWEQEGVARKRVGGGGKLIIHRVLMKSHLPSTFVLSNQKYTTSASGVKPCRMLKFFQRFGKHYSRQIQGGCIFFFGGGGDLRFVFVS